MRSPFIFVTGELFAIEWKSSHSANAISATHIVGELANFIAVVVRMPANGQIDLLDAGDARDALGGRLALAQSRQE